MATYSMNHPEKGEISYTDKKRYLWFMSITFPLMPLMTIYWFTQTGLEALLAIPLGINYLLLPALDWAIGSDSSNPPEELVPQLEEDRYYRILTYLTVPMHFIVLLAFAWIVGTFQLSVLSMLVVALVAGSYSGIGINTAHELGHRRDIRKMVSQNRASSARLWPFFSRTQSWSSQLGFNARRSG